MEFSKPTEQKDLQDYGAGDEAQEARLQEHRTPRPALKHNPSFLTGPKPIRKLFISAAQTADTAMLCGSPLDLWSHWSEAAQTDRVYLAWGRLAFSAARAFTMRVTSPEGRGRSGVKRRVPFPVSNGFNSAENWRRTLALAMKKLQ